MRTSLIAASLVAPLVAAHGGIPGAPKIFGLGPNPLARLKSRNVFHEHAARDAAPQGPQLRARQGGADGRCGPEYGGASCDAGFCCSPVGWCGVGTAYCASPDCLFQYGPACDANIVPAGTDTSGIARPQLGAVAYGGEGVQRCTVPGTVAITYDDGPYIYTDGVLDQFKAYGAKATFFITGNNNGKGQIDNAANPWPTVIRRMIAEGHQVASHTWSHQDLSAITSQQRKDQMIRNEMAIRNIIGKFPTYMRPPYSSCTAASGCQADLATLGYVVSYFDLDTDDYNNLTPELIQNAKNNFNAAVGPADPATKDFLAIAHDIHQQTAQNLTGYMLDLLTQKGFKAVTMGECLGEKEANWYRDSAGSVGTSTSVAPTVTATTSYSTGPPIATPTTVSPDGSCGGTTGYSCIGWSTGSCCSQYGWCGSGADYCSTGCQSVFGTCGSDTLPSSLSMPAVSSTVSSTVIPVTSSTRTVSSSVATPTGQTSLDGSCGGTLGYSCIGFSLGSCCSQYGWCGSTTDYCGTGCNSAFGTCGTSVSDSSSVVSVSSILSETVSQSSSTATGASSSVTQAPSSSSSTISPTSSSVASVSSISSSSSAAAPSTSSASSAALSTTSSVALSTSSSITSTRSSTITTSIRPTSTNTSAAPTSTANVSKDGKCGGTTKQTCAGYSFGNKNLECCGWYGKCGNDVWACGIGCQNKLGKCWW